MFKEGGFKVENVLMDDISDEFISVMDRMTTIDGDNIINIWTDDNGVRTILVQGSSCNGVLIKSSNG